GTQSVWIGDSNGANRTLNVDVYHTEDWSRHIIPFVHNVPLSSQAYLQFWVNKHQPDDVATLYLRNIKLEKGNKATDWTPAPEDVDAEINTVSTQVIQLADRYSVKTQKTIGGKTYATGFVSGINEQNESEFA